VLGKKCSKDHLRRDDGSVALYLPDGVIDNSNWVSIIMVSSGCRILDQKTFLEMRKTENVLMNWPEFGAARSRHMHQIAPLLWVVNEVVMEDGPLHMIDPYVVTTPKE
jgi:hypothetical protein